MSSDQHIDVEKVADSVSMAGDFGALQIRRRHVVEDPNLQRQLNDASERLEDRIAREQRESDERLEKRIAREQREAERMQEKDEAVAPIGDSE
jgi:guanylate kinase